MSELSDFVKNLEKRISDTSGSAKLEQEPLEAVLRGKAVELWSDVAGEVLFLVSDEEDARRLGEPRGSIYTASEARLVCRITDKSIVRQVHQWKRKCSGTVADFQQRGGK